MAGSARKKYTFSQYFEKNRHFCRKFSPKPYFRVLLFSPSCCAFHFRQAGIYHDQSFFPACHGEPPNHFPFVFICCRGRISAEAIGEMRNNGPGGRPSISHLGSAKISVIEKQAPVSHTPVFLSAIFAYCFRSSSTILRMTAGLPWPPAAPIVCPMRACIACTFPER